MDEIPVEQLVMLGCCQMHLVHDGSPIYQCGRCGRVPTYVMTYEQWLNV